MAKLKEETLDNFNWEGGEVDFFGEKGMPDETMVDEETRKKGVAKQEKEEEEENKKVTNLDDDDSTPETEEEEEKEEESFFGIEEEKEDKPPKAEKKTKAPAKEEKKEEEPPEESVKEDATEEEKDKNFFTQLSKELKETGVFANVEIEGEIDQDKFFELHAKEVEKRVDETFEAFFDELDDDAKKFLKFKKDGGDTATFFESVKKSVSRPKGDLADEKFQKAFLRYYYSTMEDMDAEEVEDKLVWLEDAGKLESYAKKFDKKLTNVEKAQQEALLDEQAKAAEKREKQKDAFRESMKKVLDKNDEIGGLPISQKEKSTLLKYLSSYDVKIGKNRYITRFQQDLQKTLNNDEQLVLLAKLISNGFDLSSVEKKGETKTVKKIKSELERAKSETKKPVSSGSSGKKSLSDYF